MADEKSRAQVGIAAIICPSHQAADGSVDATHHCTSKPLSETSRSGSLMRDDSEHSKLDTEPGSETIGDGTPCYYFQAAVQGTTPAEMVPAQLVRAEGVDVDAPRLRGCGCPSSDQPELPGMIAIERARRFKLMLQAEDKEVGTFDISASSATFSRWSSRGRGSTDRVEQTSEDKSDDEVQSPALATIQRPDQIVVQAGDKQRTKHAPTILITEQRRLERSLRPAAAVELLRVHFRLPKVKRTSQILQPLDRSAKAVKNWDRGLLLPIVWEIWAFPFRFAFCDVERRKSMFVYTIDVICDVWFGLAMLGDLV